MEIATASLKRPLTDLVAKDFLLFLLYGACLSYPPGSALLNVLIISVVWRRFFITTQTARLLPGLYMNLDGHPELDTIIARYERLKSQKKQGKLDHTQKREWSQLKERIRAISPKPQYALYQYRIDLIIAAIAIVLAFYRLYLLFPETMRILFGNSWQQLQ